MNAVSTRTGAIGVDPDICNGKLMVVEDGDWKNFVEQVIRASEIMTDTPQTYFDHFYWGNSTRIAAAFIENEAPPKK
jgi:hypothetical protein